jgi:hypothetical protein
MTNNLFKAEKLYSFIKRAKLLITGRTLLLKSKSKLQFIWITEDISENSLNEIKADFSNYPIIQLEKSEYFELHFALKNTKVVGFAKSDLSSSIYLELQPWRINGQKKTF